MMCIPCDGKTAKAAAGYSPACGNAWHKTLCGKPKIKCGACTNSKFLPATDQAIHDHLVGNQARRTRGS